MLEISGKLISPQDFTILPTKTFRRCVIRSASVIYTDVFTNGFCPSPFPSLVIPHFVAISVGKTKKPFADGFTDGICGLKKDSRLKYTD